VFVPVVAAVHVFETLRAEGLITRS
jgi:hypothetical protein